MDFDNQMRNVSSSVGAAIDCTHGGAGEKVHAATRLVIGTFALPSSIFGCNQLLPLPHNVAVKRLY